MTDKMIEYKSAQKTVATTTNFLETVEKDGIVCTWNGWTVKENHTGLFKPNFSWSFDWSKLKNQGVERITGYLIVKGTASSAQFGDHKIDIDFKKTSKMVTKEIQYYTSTVYVTLEYHLTPHYAQKIDTASLEKMFAASEMNDTVLVIEGKKLNVNKTFLSYHSEFFRALFSSNFKEGQLTEIPIKDVTYEDFGLLMITVYPKQVFPNDTTAEKLLELADRFLMPSVTSQVEYHLLNLSGISNEKMIWMADKYGMKNLLEKMILSMDTLEKAKKLKTSPEYQKLSKDAKSSIFERLFQLI